MSNAREAKARESACVIAIAAGVALAIVGCKRDAPAPSGPAPGSAASATPTVPLSPPSVMGTVALATSDAGAKPFGAACTADADCAAKVCFRKRAHPDGERGHASDAGHERRGADDPVEKDGYCSMKCDDDDDCPVPLTKGKCGGRGMCKRPD